MKKLLVVLMVLSMATIANAGLQIGVNGVVDQPDTSVTVLPSDTVVLSIVDVQGQAASAFDAFLVIQGPGTIANGTLVYTYGLSAWTIYDSSNDVGYLAGLQAMFDDYTIAQVGDLTLADTSDPLHAIQGVLADNIVFHCDGPGEVLLTLCGLDGDGALFTMDTQVIHQIPEPMTMGLLGLGGLFLRRRK